MPLAWCERQGVGYTVGMAKHKRLNRLAAQMDDDANGHKQRQFHAARTWDRPRRVVVKAEHTGLGSNPRSVVTHLPGDPKRRYDKVCSR